MSHIHRCTLTTFFVITLTLALGGVSSAQTQAEVSIDIPRLEGTVHADGILDENVWTNATRTELPLRLYQEADETDLSGEALIFWNPAGVYVGARVTDDDLMLADESSDLAEFDSVAIWLNNLWIRAGLAHDESPRAQLDYLAGFHSFPVSFEVGIAKEDNGYTVELHIPSDVLEGALKVSWVAGTKIGYAVGLSDRDQDDETAKSLRYFPRWFGWNNTDSMAKATLR